MNGVTNANLGEARGDANGEAVDDLLRNMAEDDGVRVARRGEAGVGVRAICHGAGEARRMTVWREGGLANAPSCVLEERNFQSASRTVFSSSFPARADSARTRSSIFSVRSSSSSSLS
jgi:hypothetical protein